MRCFTAISLMNVIFLPEFGRMTRFMASKFLVTIR